MAYHLKSGEPVPEGIKRIAGEEIAAAAAQLSATGAHGRDQRIHEARKNVKKIRGVLRLMRPELGEVYRIENLRLRNAGRKLSVFRDAGAMIETFDALREKYRDDLGSRTLASIRRGLVARKAQAEKKAQLDQTLARVAATLRRTGNRVTAWPLRDDGFSAIAPGLEETFRLGRRALDRARKHPRPENYHEWRKRVKDHWYHVRLLENLWTDVMQAYEKSLKELETWLGEEHNLVVLEEKVRAEPGFFGSERDLALFFGLIKRYHKELRGNAEALGERIYQGKPRQFTRRMRQLWDAWQAQPKSLTEAEKAQAGTAA